MLCTKVFIRSQRLVLAALLTAAAASHSGLAAYEQGSYFFTALVEDLSQKAPGKRLVAERKILAPTNATKATRKAVTLDSSSALKSFDVGTSLDTDSVFNLNFSTGPSSASSSDSIDLSTLRIDTTDTIIGSGDYTIE